MTMKEKRLVASRSSDVVAMDELIELRAGIRMSTPRYGYFKLKKPV